MTHRRAFTLTDILVTVFVVAILIAIAMPMLSRAQRQAEIGRKKADLNAVTVALESFKAKHGDYPRMNLVTMRRLMKNASEAEVIRAFNQMLDSQTRGSQILTMALLDSGLLGDSFRTVEVYDQQLKADVRLLATHDDRPILYYPALPVRLDLSKDNSYVASMGPAAIFAAQQSAAGRAGATWQMPLFNAWDNEQFLNETLVRQQLDADEATGRSKNTLPAYSGAYLLWAAGNEADLQTAYTSQSAVMMVGGGQPMLMMATGPGVANPTGAGLVQYAAYVPNTGSGSFTDSAYFRPDAIDSNGNPFRYKIPPTGNPPPGWQDHEIPPRNPATPPADAIKITDKGAKPGDGVDDWQAIKDALEQARKDGKAIVIPDGNFDISKPLDVRGGDKIFGPGTLKLASGNDFGIIIPGGSNGVLIDGIILDGGGIWCTNLATNITVTNNIIQNITHGGRYNNGAAFNSTGGLIDSRIESNHFINVQQEGVWINTAASGTSVSYNYFEDVWQPIHVTSERAATGIKFNGNYGVGMTRMGIEFQGHHAVGSEIIANTFKDWKKDKVYYDSFGLSIYNLGSGTRIEDNMLLAYPNNPLGIEMGGYGSIAKGNVVSGFREGMHVIHADESVVSGNTFTGQTWMSIWFPGYGPAKNVQITDNSFDLSAEAAILFMGSGWGGTTIENNTAKLGGNTQFVKSHSGTNGINVGKNTITH